jgi:hypothetical protein
MPLRLALVASTAAAAALFTSAGGSPAGLHGGGCTCDWHVGDMGELHVGGWRLLSTFSLPSLATAGPIRFLALPPSNATGAAAAVDWTSLSVTRSHQQGSQDQETTVTAVGPLFTLTRTIACNGDHLAWTDKMVRAADGAGPAAVRMVHTLQPSAGKHAALAELQSLLGGVETRQLSGGAEGASNPTALLAPFANATGTAAELNGVALVVQDTLSRYHIDLSAAALPNGNGALRAVLENFAMAAGSARTFEKLIFPLVKRKGSEESAVSDYWSFINRVRAVWQVNHEVAAFDFGPPAQYWETKGAVGPYLQKKHLTTAAPLAWLDYDNGYLPNNVTIAQQRQQYKADAQLAMAAFRGAAGSDFPHPKVVGNLEGPSWSLTERQAEVLFGMLPASERGAGYPKETSSAQTALLRAHEEAWQLPLETLPRSKAGNFFFELYFRPDANGVSRPLISLMSYPRTVDGKPNKQSQTWLERADFLINDCGIDGVYIDGAGPINALTISCDTPNGFDGVSVQMDDSGHIKANCTDWRLASVPAVTALFSSVVRRNKTMVANGWCTAFEHQSMPVLRFAETGGVFDPRTVPDGQMPPAVPVLMGGHLTTPLALADITVQSTIHDPDRFARFIMKSVMLHLRHGLLFAYYSTDIPGINVPPRTFHGNGSYAALNAMLPLKPVGLHPGWIVGEERTVTALSGSFTLAGTKGVAKPSVQYFGLLGTPELPLAPAVVTWFSGSTGDGDGDWIVRIRIKDWAQFAVLRQGSAMPPTITVKTKTDDTLAHSRRADDDRRRPVRPRPYVREGAPAVRRQVRWYVPQGDTANHLAFALGTGAATGFYPCCGSWGITACGEFWGRNYSWGDRTSNPHQLGQGDWKVRAGCSCRRDPQHYYHHHHHHHHQQRWAPCCLLTTCYCCVVKSQSWMPG